MENKVEKKDGIGYMILLVVVAVIVTSAIYIMLSSIFHYYYCVNYFNNLTANQNIVYSFSEVNLQGCITGISSTTHNYNTSTVFSPIFYKKLVYVSIFLVFGEWFIISMLLIGILKGIIDVYNKRRGKPPASPAVPEATAAEAGTAQAS